jgi:hypothetical protein
MTQVTIRTKSHDACGEPAVREVSEMASKHFLAISKLNSALCEIIEASMKAQDDGLTPAEFFVTEFGAKLKSSRAEMRSHQVALTELGFSKWDIRTDWSL